MGNLARLKDPRHMEGAWGAHHPKSGPSWRIARGLLETDIRVHTSTILTRHRVVALLAVLRLQLLPLQPPKQPHANVMTGHQLRRQSASESGRITTT